MLIQWRVVKKIIFDNFIGDLGDHFQSAKALPQPGHHWLVHHHPLLPDHHCPHLEGVPLPRQPHSISHHHQWPQHALQWEGGGHLHQASYPPHVSIFSSISIISSCIRFSNSKDHLILTSTHLYSKEAKIQPQFDSAVPLNPWSKVRTGGVFNIMYSFNTQVSLGGYMVARAKKVLGKLVENKIGKAFKDVD